MIRERYSLEVCLPQMLRLYEDAAPLMSVLLTRLTVLRWGRPVSEPCIGSHPFW
jgi:hypothetical protein